MVERKKKIIITIVIIGMFFSGYYLGFTFNYGNFIKNDTSINQNNIEYNTPTNNYAIMIPSDSFASYEVIYSTDKNKSLTDLDVYIYYNLEDIPIEVLRILYDNNCLDKIWIWMDRGNYYIFTGDGWLYNSNLN